MRSAHAQRTPSESPGPRCTVPRLCASAKNSVHVPPNETRFFCDARALLAALPLARLGVAGAAEEAAAAAADAPVVAPVAEVTSTLAWGASAAPAAPRRKRVRMLNAQPNPAECPVRELGSVPSAQQCNSNEYSLTTEGFSQTCLNLHHCMHCKGYRTKSGTLVRIRVCLQVRRISRCRSQTRQDERVSVRIAVDMSQNHNW